MKRAILLSVATLILLLVYTTLPVRSYVASELTYQPRNAKGMYAFVEYLGGVGRINLVNGNLIFGRQLVTRPGRAGFAASLSVIYNSKLWDREGSVMKLMEPGSWVGLGWRLEMPKVLQGSTSYAVVFPDGSSHELVDDGTGVLRSVDSTYIVVFDLQSATAWLKGGTQLVFGHQIGSIYYLTEMKDRNGNQIQVSYVAGTGKIHRVDDTLGSIAVFSYDADSFLEKIESYGKTNTTIDFIYTDAVLSPTFTLSSQVPTGEKFLSEILIKLPMSDLKQVFAYNAFGELTEIRSVVIKYGYDGQG
ncbi:hypothetical protein MYX65_13165, partial [Acidobacteria bacterium AH-259-L09]|nr:hypothetical protein [Acidobacteria bacterium AH-259-L09]